MRQRGRQLLQGGQRGGAHPVAHSLLDPRTEIPRGSRRPVAPPLPTARNWWQVAEEDTDRIWWDEGPPPEIPIGYEISDVYFQMFPDVSYKMIFHLSLEDLVPPSDDPSPITLPRSMGR